MYLHHLAVSLLANNVLGQAFYQSTPPFYLSLHSASEVYNDTSLVVCAENQGISNLCWWNASAESQAQQDHDRKKERYLRFAHSDFDFSSQGALVYQWTYLNESAATGITLQWVNMGFLSPSSNSSDKSSARNMSRAAFSWFPGLLPVEYVAFEPDTGRLVKLVWNQQDWVNEHVSLWWMCEVFGGGGMLNRRRVLHWGGLGEGCVGVEVVRVDGSAGGGTVTTSKRAH